MAKSQPNSKSSPKGKPAAAKTDVAKTYGRYRVLSPLGQGAMASVFLAEDPSLGRLVAVKVIHLHLASQAELLTRFTTEAKTAASLRSPNIVEVFDYGLEGEAQYLVMEYIDGPTLQQVLNLQMGEPFSSKLAASLAVQAAEGLMVAERKTVVHRDMKPENLMLTSAGLLKIADFGIAHLNEQNLTRTGSILGSPSYMAPEQIEGGKPSHQTDMFALGAVFYACLTGRKPFNGPNIPSIFRAICELPHKPVLEINPDCDPQLAAMVEVLLSKEPGARGSGAKAFSLQLRQWLNQQGVFDPAQEVRDMLSQLQPHGDQTMLEPGGASPQPMAPPDSDSHSEDAKKETKPKPVKKTASQPFQWPLIFRAYPKWIWGAIGAGSLLLVLVVILIVRSTSHTDPVSQPLPVLETVTASSPLPVTSEPTPTPILPPAPVKDSTPSASTVTTPITASTPVTATPASALVDSTGPCELNVVSAPPFAEVFLDGRYLGATPLKGKVVSSGRHKLLISHRRFESIDTTLRLRTGSASLKFRFATEKPK